MCGYSDIEGIYPLIEALATSGDCCCFGGLLDVDVTEATLRAVPGADGGNVLKGQFMFVAALLASQIGEFATPDSPLPMAALPAAMRAVDSLMRANLGAEQRKVAGNPPTPVEFVETLKKLLRKRAWEKGTRQLCRYGCRPAPPCAHPTL